MREVVFHVLAERPGHLEAKADTLPIRITAPTLEELQHEAREAPIEHLGPAQLYGSRALTPRPRYCHQQHPTCGPPCSPLPLSWDARSKATAITASITSSLVLAADDPAALARF